MTPPTTSGTGRESADSMPLPAAFVERIRAQLGTRAGDFFRALAAPPLGLRVNTLRIEPAEFQRISHLQLEPLPFPPGGFLIAADARAGRSPHHAAGLYYVQDPGAMAAGALVDAQPGERVLDVAAAPGGKSTQIASQMHDDGLLVANDPVPERARELAGNLERWGARNVIVTAEPIDRLAGRFGAWFDRVLLDAPCSGEAMFHKSAAACADWSPAGVLGCARRQAELLAEAALLVRPTGRLIYSTCTFSPEENEQVVGTFLDGHPEFSLVDPPPVVGFAAGHPEWASDSARRDELRRAVRLWPHRMPGAGHFVALLARAADGPRGDPRPHRSDVPHEARRAWSDFRAGALESDPSDGRSMELRGHLLSTLPPGTPDVSGLRVLRAGLPLGTVRKGRLDPAHALAMSLRPTDVHSHLPVVVDSLGAAAYLRGETLAAEGPPGWLLVTVDGYPLGWGKRVGTTVKNHYPKGLRRPMDRRG